MKKQPCRKKGILALMVAALQLKVKIT